MSWRIVSLVNCNSTLMWNALHFVVFSNPCYEIMKIEKFTFLIILDSISYMLLRKSNKIDWYLHFAEMSRRNVSSVNCNTTLICNALHFVVFSNPCYKIMEIIIFLPGHSGLNFIHACEKSKQNWLISAFSRNVVTIRFLW